MNPILPRWMQLLMASLATFVGVGVILKEEKWTLGIVLLIYAFLTFAFGPKRQH